LKYSYKNYNDTGKYLINECNKKEININIIKYLVNHRVDINKKSYGGRTPLFIACNNGNEILIKQLKFGADINKKDCHGETPLFNACQNGNETIVKCLVDLGADVNITDKCGRISLFLACSNGNEMTVKYLITFIIVYLKFIFIY